MCYFVNLAPPTAEEFISLRSLVGWGETDLSMAGQSLAHSLFHVTVRNNGKLAGMGRVIGDGGLFFYIQDIVVSPAHQGKGVGHMLMTEIERYIACNARAGSTVALLSAQGKEPFYARYGYLVRSGKPLGLGMCKFL